MKSELLEWFQNHDLSPFLILKVLFSAMTAILFLQSGLDKIFDWLGNKSWLNEHFKDSPLKNLVGLMLPVITGFEVLAGMLSGIGMVFLLVGGSPDVAMIGLILAALSIVQLFFGQRMAKDYVGAAALVPYFLMLALGLMVFMVDA